MEKKRIWPVFFHNISDVYFGNMRLQDLYNVLSPFVLGSNIFIFTPSSCQRFWLTDTRVRSRVYGTHLQQRDLRCLFTYSVEEHDDVSAFVTIIVSWRVARVKTKEGCIGPSGIIHTRVRWITHYRLFAIFAASFRSNDCRHPCFFTIDLLYDTFVLL